MPVRPILLALLVAALALPACGGDEEASSTPPPAATATPTPPIATAPSAPSPPPDAPTPTPTATATPGGGAPDGGGESGEGGGGDEAGARIPVAVTAGSDGTLSPARVAVPAFFRLELQVRNRTGAPITVRWEDSEPAGAFAVGTGKVGTRLVAGVPKGDHALTVEGLGTITIAAGAEPGP